MATPATEKGSSPKYKSSSPLTVVSGGDPAGIGPELIEKAFTGFLSQHSKHRFVYFSTAAGQHKENIQALCQKEGMPFLPGSGLSLPAGLPEQAGALVFYDLASALSAKDIEPGRPSKASGALAFAALKAACDFALSYGCTGMLTAPLAKEWVVQSGQRSFRGHTGYLAQRFACEVLMLMHGMELSVIPLTVHIPLKKVPLQLKQALGNPALPKLLKKIQQMPGYTKRPWALCGLNPHAGENGLMGSEEKFLKKFCQGLRKHGIALKGPLSADTLFMLPNRNGYRLILSCYHDQGLIPFKALEGQSGVNCTIGLPFLRTSPDHGTAFALANKGKANAGSMRRALELAVQG